MKEKRNAQLFQCDINRRMAVEKKMEEITFNWKWERKMELNFHDDNQFDLQLNLKLMLNGRKKEESHHLTMWYLSYVCQLWLEICCWRNFLFSFLLRVPLCLPQCTNMHVVWTIHISIFFLFVRETEEKKRQDFSVSHSTLALTHIYLPLALSNKVSVPLFHKFFGVVFIWCNLIKTYRLKGLGCRCQRHWINRDLTREQSSGCRQEKNTTWKTFVKAFLCSLNRTCSIPFFLGLASSQLCGAIDFNIIDFLCHYQPLALLRFLFFWFCAHKNVSVSEWHGRAKATA